MDTRSSSRVEQLIAQIKSSMPETYSSIQRKASDKGRGVYALVRAGLGGKPNCFWAMEAGHVMGTPFDLQSADPELALAMVRYGSKFVCIIGEELQ